MNSNTFHPLIIRHPLGAATDAEIAVAPNPRDARSACQPNGVFIQGRRTCPLSQNRRHDRLSTPNWTVCDRKREMPPPRTKQGPRNGKAGHRKNGGSNESSNMSKIISQKKTPCRIWLLSQDLAECTSPPNSGRQRACGPTGFS